MFTIKTSVERLQEETSKVLSIFSKTIDKLVIVNEECLNTSNSNKIVIKELEKENTDLDSIRITNSKIITNIKNLYK